ncbi:UDP-N-acetylmuramoyl-L-alanine--D-glutamate ligase [Endozoicomonas sp. (ex Bugula neritina AB1)]|nr:UDP-N-acetylmuramoyl-L-alanine--D-glutamate ligase [Endozoicomonas sp. (ex Bugula neritina AB1)]
MTSEASQSTDSSLLISSSCHRVIIGLGKTGMSCVRYLANQGVPFRVIDTRSHPPGIDELKSEYPDIPVHTGGFNRQWMMDADELIVSPGIALAEPAITEAIASGVKAIGDIELFCRAVRSDSLSKPIVAITGSNGKSTVTTLLGEMVEASGLSVGVGGNIGTPALELLINPTTDLYVLELSSFQLETTEMLQAAAATVLNISPDHMDRYSTLVDYHRAKQAVYRGCATAVFNREDPLTSPLLPVTADAVTFTTKAPDLGQYGLLEDEQGVWLSKGLEKLLNTSEMRIRGRHNQQNALAALALGESVGLRLDAMVDVLKTFTGLSHRCQWLAEVDGVSWFNDSKATNVGAAVAAINGLGADLPGDVILIAGGDGKGADFSELKTPIADYVEHLILIGRDGSLIGQVAQGSTHIHSATTMADAVQQCTQLATAGDAVLLAPACASFDMFDSFEHRGEVYSTLVRERIKC